MQPGEFVEDVIVVAKAQEEEVVQHQDRMIIDVQKLDNTEIVNDLEMAGPLN